MRTDISDIIGRLDDLELVSNDLHGIKAFTLTCVVHNEMYFLPAFLAHYRHLGVERFVFLDDQSTDGTREFLGRQGDCMVLQSRHRFNEMLTDESGWRMNQPTRWINVWVNVLARRFHADQWGVHVDADEFLQIPQDTTLLEFIEAHTQSRAGGIWSTMLDMYPATIADLDEMKNDQRLDMDRPWYYDARRHFYFRNDGRLKRVYAGSRARLMHQYKIRNPSLIKTMKYLFRVPGYNEIRKVVLMKLPPDGYFISPHKPQIDCIAGVLLPLEHYKFTGQLYNRVSRAIERKSHWRDSVEYKQMAELLARMHADNGSFICTHSSFPKEFADYREVGIAIE